MNGKAVIFDDISEDSKKLPKEIFKLISLNAAGGKSIHPFASVGLEIKGKGCVNGSGFGNGPIDATYNVIAKLTQSKAELIKFSLHSSGKGADAQGTAVVKLRENRFVVFGRGVDPDIITASAKAYIDGLNQLEYLKANSV